MATATVVGLVLAEQLRSLPEAVVAHGAAWWIGRQARVESVRAGGATG